MTPLIRRLYPHYVLVVFLLLSLSSSFSFTLGQSPPPPPPQPDPSVRLEYSGGHIAASYIIATLGSGTALQVMKQRTGLQGARNWLLLGGGSLALGVVGIWCMHFIGMLSLSVYDAQGNMLRMAFEPGLTTASLFIAVTIIGAGFALAGDPKRAKIWRTCLVGVIGGIGVSAMHYTGMMAMKCQAEITWDAGIIVASVIVGIVAATAALLIFFHFSHIWQDDMRLQVGTAAIMGVAVCGMHYTGMFAASWHNSFKEPSFGNDATSEALTGVVIGLSVATCSVLLAVLFYRFRLMQRNETRKTTCLTLSALVRDSQGRVLCTLAHTLPSVVIDAAYVSQGANNSGSFNRLNPDFLRMLKISFSWSNVARYQRHLSKLHATGAITTQSMRLFDGFIAAANKLSSQFGIPLAQMGFLYFAPTGNMVTLVVKASAATSISLQDTTSGLRFMQPNQIVSSLAQFQLVGSELDPLTWLADVRDYGRRVLLPITGEARRDELLNDFLREAATELLIESETIEDEIRQWRQILGKYVVTRHHLTTLVNNRDQWREVKLEPMVKAQINAQINLELQLAMNNAHADREQNAEHQMEGSVKGERDQPSDAPRPTPAVTSIPSTLYLGLLYVQVTATGLRVLVLRDGPLSMIPIVKFNSQHSIGGRELEWLRDGVGTKKKLRQSKLRMTGSKLPLTTHGSNGPVVADTLRPHGSNYDGASIHEPSMITRSNPPPRIMPPSFLAFQADFVKCVEDLGKAVGTKIDLTLDNLWTEQVIVLSPEVHLVCFTHSTMQTAFPAEYSPLLTQFIPFPVFEIIHFAQHHSRTAANWTRRLVAASVQNQKKAQVAGGVTGTDRMEALQAAVNAANDVDLNSVFGSEKTQGRRSSNDDDSEIDELPMTEDSSAQAPGYEESGNNHHQDPHHQSPSAITSWTESPYDGTQNPLPGQPEPSPTSLAMKRGTHNGPLPSPSSQSYSTLTPNAMTNGTGDFPTSTRNDRQPRTNHIRPARGSRASSTQYQGSAITNNTANPTNSATSNPATDHVHGSPSIGSFRDAAAPTPRVIAVPMPIADSSVSSSNPPNDVVIHVHSRNQRSVMDGAIFGLAQTPTASTSTSATVAGSSTSKNEPTIDVSEETPLVVIHASDVTTPI